MHSSKFHTPATTRTHPLWWCIAIICSVIAVAVIIAGIVIFVGYLVVHPRIPIISVLTAHLNLFEYDMSGILVTQVNIIIRSQNDNTRAHASFSEMKLNLFFDGIKIVTMKAGEYDVRKNSSLDFNFLATSEPIPLNPDQMKDVDFYLNQDIIRFDLKGSVKARWKVALLGSAKFRDRLDCQLKFHRSNGSFIPDRRCTSKSK